MKKIILFFQRNSAYWFCIVLCIIYGFIATLSAQNANDIGSNIYIQFFNGIQFQWMILTAYIFWIYTSDMPFHNDLLCIRFTTRTNLFFARLKNVIIRSLQYILLLWILFIVLCFTDHFNDYATIGFFPTLLGLFNMSLGIVVIGIGAVSLSTLSKNARSYIWFYLFVFLCIGFDCMGCLGYLRFRLPILYEQLMSMQIFITNDTGISFLLLSASNLMIKGLVCGFLGFVFSRLDRRRRQSRLHLFAFFKHEWKKTLFAIPIGIGIALIFSGSTESIEQFCIRAFGGFAAGENEFSFMLLVYALPLMIQLYLFSTLMRSDFETASVYLFTRTTNRRQWLLQKAGIILACSLLFWAFLILSGVATAMIMGLPMVAMHTLVHALYSLFCTVVIYSTALALLSNILSIKIGSGIAFLIVVVASFGTQFLISALAKNVGSWLIQAFPSMQGLLSWHDTPLRALDSMYFSSSINHFTPLFSFIYCFLCMIGLLFLGSRWMNKKNL